MIPLVAGVADGIFVAVWTDLNATSAHGQWEHYPAAKVRAHRNGPRRTRSGSSARRRPNALLRCLGMDAPGFCLGKLRLLFDRGCRRLPENSCDGHESPLAGEPVGHTRAADRQAIPPCTCTAQRSSQRGAGSGVSPLKPAIRESLHRIEHFVLILPEAAYVLPHSFRNTGSRQEDSMHVI